MMFVLFLCCLVYFVLLAGLLHSHTGRKWAHRFGPFESVWIWRAICFLLWQVLDFLGIPGSSWCFPAPLIFCFSAFLLLCFSASLLSLLLCFSTSLFSLLLFFSCFSAFCFHCFFAFPASPLFCFSAFIASLLFLLFCFSAFCFPCFSAFPACLLLCCSAFCCPCFFAFLLLCFSCFFAFLLLCLSTSTIFYYSTLSFLQSCVLAALLPAPLLICFLSLLSLCCSFSFASFFPVYILNETLERPWVKPKETLYK